MLFIRGFLYALSLMMVISASSPLYAMDPTREYNAKKAECMTYCMRNLGKSSEWCSTNVDPNTTTGCFKTFTPTDCPLPWGGSLSHGQSVTAYQSATVLSPASCSSVNRLCDNGILKGKQFKYPSCTLEYRPCNLPWGGSIQSGQNITAYQSSNVVSPATCISETRSCSDGTLGGSYGYSSCSVSAPPPSPCTLPWGGNIADSQSVTAYQSPNVVSPATCISETRSCSNGSLSGIYGYSSCTVSAPPPSPCTLPWGGNIADGQSVTAYQSSSVVSPATCTSESRTCSNGSLSGGYGYSSCSVSAPPPSPCTLPWGGNIADGQTVTAYQSGSVVSPATCTSESRTCSNGSLGGSYGYSSCSVGAPPPSPCTLPWGGNIADGQTVTAYQSGSVVSPATCSSESRSCSNGSLGGSYGYSSCSVSAPPPPAGCSLPWGGSISDGQSITAYQSGSVMSPATCSSQTRSCSNGSLSGSYGYSSCSVSAPPSPCTLPWGGNIADGQSVTAYQSSSVVSPATCSSESRSCSNGSLGGSYGYSSCSVTAPPPSPCTLPWGGNIADGQSVTAYQSSSVVSPATCASQSRSCSNGSLGGSYGYSSCSVTAPPAGCSLPWGGSISHAQSVTAYQSSSVVSPATCNSESRSCSNGSLGGSYGYSSCTVTPSTAATCVWKTTGGAMCGPQVFVMEADKHCESFAGFAGVGSDGYDDGATCNYGQYAGSGIPFGTCGGSSVYQYTMICQPKTVAPSPPVTKKDTLIAGNVLDNDIISNGPGRITTIGYYKSVLVGGGEYDARWVTANIRQDGAMDNIRDIDLGQLAQKPKTPTTATLKIDMYGNYEIKVYPGTSTRSFSSVFSVDYTVVDAKGLSATGYIDIKGLK